MDSLFISIDNFLKAYSWWGFPASFLGGILSAFSPCVFPLIGVIISIIGEATLELKSKAIFLSLIFVAGFTFTYITIGIFASLFGIFIGKVVNAYIISLFLGGVFIFLGLCFFDVFHIPVFSIDYSLRTTFFSIFLWGVLSGLSMLPCVFPILGSIFSIISFKRDILYGILCLTFFSLGYGIVLITVGSSMTFIKRLSRKPVWFIIIKKMLGMVIFFIGVYFIISTLGVII